MFYSLSLLSRKGPLGTIWIAAYCFKKLKRGQIASTDISSTVDKIMPEFQISQRVLAQLLLGIVKIFSKKVDFLYDECNEALNQMRKFLPFIQRIAQNKASAKPRKGIRDSKELTAARDDVVKTVKEHATEQQIETMRASYQEVTVTLPEQFELDSFDFGDLNDGDYDQSCQHSTPLDKKKDDRNSRPSYLIECLDNEVADPSEYKSFWFTPLVDVLPSSLMDVEIGFSDTTLQNSSDFASVQKSLERFHSGGEFEVRVCLSGSEHLQDEIQPLNHEQEMPSVENEILPVAEQTNPAEIINLQGGKPSSMMDGGPELSESHNLINFASGQKSLEESNHRGDFEKQACLAVSAPLHNMIRESHIQVNHEQTMPPAVDKEQRNLTVTINSQEESTSERSKINSISDKHADASPSDKQKQNISVNASPTFMLATPAIKESSRVFRKRKKKSDESIVLSNEFMRQNMLDASNLVCKRRKLPHTDLDNWKFWRFSNLCQSLTDPLISFSSPAQKKLPLTTLQKLSKKSADGLVEFSNKEIETKDLMQEEDSTQKYHLLRETIVDHIDPTNMEDPMPHRSTETETEVLTQKLDTTCLAPSKSSDPRANTLENASKEFTIPDVLDQQLELCFRGDDIDKKSIHSNSDDGWSPRTRAAAQHLYGSFLRLREQRGVPLSLAQILEGKTRKTSAIFIYEMLTLKTYGCIDVGQDFPYGDVSVSATPVLESFHKVFM